MFPLFQFTLDLKSRVDEISPVNQFEPAFEGVIRVIFFVAALAAFFYMIWGALDWILSQGDSGKIEAARRKITHAVIGLVILACVGVIFMIVQSFIGISITGGGGSGGVGDASCSVVCPANTTCQNGVCVNDPS